MKNLKTICLLLAVLVAGSLLFQCKPKTQNNDDSDNAAVGPALAQILSKGKPGPLGAFVIFGGKSDYDYVQYALHEKGLLLNWPTVQKGGAERLPDFVSCLVQKGFQEIRPDSTIPEAEQVEKLSIRQFIILSDGLYAEAGKDVEEIKTLTLHLMKTVFKVLNETEINITLELEG
ncbi:MAG: hypothetical protein NTZ12_00120 [Candidatus Aminicenantes bacterium]|nr:hypothetical protein [Candidatus Aminicenantes bacterium]